MKHPVLLFLVLMALSLNAQQESMNTSELPSDPIQKLVQTYCGDRPITMSFLVQYSDGSQREVPRNELNGDRKIDPKLVVVGEKEPGGQYAICKNMVLKKAIDADVSTLIEENKRLRSTLHSFCALPDIGRTAKESCSAFWRDLDGKRK